MDPRTLLRPEPELVRRPEETSPASHLAKLRDFKKWQPESASTVKYETAVNRMWRNRYIRLYEEENE